MSRRTLSVYRLIGLVLTLCAWVACGSSARQENREQEQGEGDKPSSSASSNPYSERVIVQLGDDLLPAVRARVLRHLESVSVGGVAAIEVVPAGREVSIADTPLTIAIGETWASKQIISEAERDALPAEGYALRSSAEKHILAVRGSVKPSRAKQVESESKSKSKSPPAPPRATAYGAYAALSQLGFAFLHPIAPEPIHPRTLRRASSRAFALSDADKKEAPRWPVRGLQLHTMHPIELTNLLEGWGIHGPEDEAGFQSMMPDWESFLEWMLANGLNQVHWVMLEADDWKQFSMSEMRRQRLITLVSRAHAFGITVGVDVPIVLKQQNTFRLIVDPNGNVEDERAQLRRRIDWLMSAGFDYVATENGTTEFTHVEAQRMLGWMNDLTRHVGDQYGRPTYVKLHCSTGQKADGFIDPATGQPINYNYLPHFADPRLGVLPHTVQHYGLDDPAPTYGNTTFGYVRDFLRREVGRREVLWHPETAYWVSFDVDVPLFLPVYAHRRVHDLRLLASDEEAGLMGEGIHAGEHMDGQNTFSSGWEWGYWLNDVVTARAAWNPRLNDAKDDAALGAILDDVFAPFDPTSRTTLRDLIVETARVERALLIEGKSPTHGLAQPPPDPASVVRRNGQAYLQGFETWDDVSDLGARLPGIPAVQMTQPARLGLVEMRLPIHPGPRYTGDVENLLREMETQFATLSAKWDAARSLMPRDNELAFALESFDDLQAAMKMTALRARQIHGLYDYVDQRNDIQPQSRLARLAAARSALDEAASLVKIREPKYRVHPDRIASWGVNPTAYRFGYLWTVRSLYYWWRDEGLAVDAPRSPCYLNVLSMTDVGLGEGAYGSPTTFLRTVLDNPAAGGDHAECLAAPSQAPSFPQFGLRSRP